MKSKYFLKVTTLLVFGSFCFTLGFAGEVSANDNSSITIEKRVSGLELKMTMLESKLNRIFISLEKRISKLEDDQTSTPGQSDEQPALGGSIAKINGKNYGVSLLGSEKYQYTRDRRDVVNVVSLIKLTDLETNQSVNVDLFSNNEVRLLWIQAIGYNGQIRLIGYDLKYFGMVMVSFPKFKNLNDPKVTKPVVLSLGKSCGTSVYFGGAPAGFQLRSVKTSSGALDLLFVFSDDNKKNYWSTLNNLQCVEGLPSGN